MKTLPPVSVIIPVFNKLAFTKQCLASLDRHSSPEVSFDVIVVDNGSSDGTSEFLNAASYGFPLQYVRNDANLGFSRANNLAARQARGEYLLFLNNDVIVTAGWLTAMLELATSDSRIGIVGLKQLFPYTNRIHHVGIIFDEQRRPQHLYPHADASLRHTNKQRAYQAVTGSCLLIDRHLFEDCGMFDEAYKNGYEDIDLCLKVRESGRQVMCCTRSFVYHYGQITETRTADDGANAARLAMKWHRVIEPDERLYFQQDQYDLSVAAKAVTSPAQPKILSADTLYFADSLSAGSALTWVTAELVLAMHKLGAPVALRRTDVSPTIDREKRRTLENLMVPERPVGGMQVRWSHYWPQHLGLELNGRTNLELFVINYLFAKPNSEPWDYWIQCLSQNHYVKLPLSSFCRDVLMQAGVSVDGQSIIRPGYAPEIDVVDKPARRDHGLRLLTVTNSHDLERYGTALLLEAYWRTFSKRDDVTLVIKDYGAQSGDVSIRDMLKDGADRARVEHHRDFTSKAKLIELYQSCDAFVSAHRGEGYAMKILDAMACGLPVVTPVFGGPADFCNGENCLPVDFTMTPVGDCFDTRALRITNSPMWANPDVDSLGAQMRRIVEDGPMRRRLGELGREQARDRFTWTHAAEQLYRFTTSLPQADLAVSSVALARARPVETSAYWLGCRISVIIPTYNRKTSLANCLAALERQTILPQEFEVIVIDDGSTDGTDVAIESQTFPFSVTYHRQVNQGPGAARNEGLRRAQGELVLYIGDDIIADERLLEEHLLAHSTRPAQGTAILGHIEWAPHLKRTAVMDFVCGESSLQFAYVHIPNLEKLDYRFFYTSNISLKRSFLQAAMADGVFFDPCFTEAAFEDSELAIRLEARGLDIQYCAQAMAYHDHWMDVDSFSRREFSAGKMAVVAYRKHPQLDDQLQVRWIGDWVDAVERLVTNPELDARIRALDVETDAFLASLARSFEELAGVQATLDANFLGPTMGAATTRGPLNGVLKVIFDVQRTRGKVEEWYRGVHDRSRVDAARRLLSCSRKLEFFSVTPYELEKLKSTISWLDWEVAGDLKRRVLELEHQLSSGHGRSSRQRLRRLLYTAAKRTDLFVQYQLGKRAEGRLLNPYQAAREKLKRFVM
jgi:GT2 family glycosyltransferase/glycosyltransferase involved in cell wall biosynthesis